MTAHFGADRLDDSMSKGIKSETGSGDAENQNIDRRLVPLVNVLLSVDRKQRRERGDGVAGIFQSDAPPNLISLAPCAKPEMQAVKTWISAKRRSVRGSSGRSRRSNFPRHTDAARATEATVSSGVSGEFGFTRKCKKKFFLTVRSL